MSSMILFESLVAGIATLLGAAMVCSFGQPRARLLASFMGFAAGVMACVVIFDLLPYSYSFGSLLYTLIGFWSGVVLMQVLEAGVGGLARRKLAAREEKARREAERQAAWAARQQELAARRRRPAYAGTAVNAGSSVWSSATGWGGRGTGHGEVWVSPAYRKSAADPTAGAEDSKAGRSAGSFPGSEAGRPAGSPAIAGGPAAGLLGSGADSLTSLAREGSLGLAAAASESAAMLEAAEAAADENAAKPRLSGGVKNLFRRRSKAKARRSREAALGPSAAEDRLAEDEDQCREARPAPAHIDLKANASRYFQLGLLVAIGIALHDLPEGMAIAAGHTAQSETGMMLALAIGLHNIPEGIASATPFVMAGVKRRWILFSMLLISFFTPLGAWLGLLLLGLGPQLISVLLALAAGAMISLVIREMIPEAWAINKLTSSLGFFAGCGLLLFMTFYLHH